MIQISNIDHVVLRTEQPDALVVFYCDVLGCTLERRTSLELGLVQLRAGNALIDILAVNSELGRLGGAAPGKQGRNMDHFCVLIDPFDEKAILYHLTAYFVTGSKHESLYLA